MALKLRLARAGSKKRPYYHIVVADVRSPRDGRFIEQVGSWNPMLPKDGDAPRVKLDEDRIKHWLGVGAQPTDRVLRFLDQAGLAARPARNNPKKALPGKKAQERIEEQRMKEEEASQAAEEATAPEAEAEAPAEEAEAPAEEAKAAEEAPAEEASAEEVATEEAPSEEETKTAAAE